MFITLEGIEGSGKTTQMKNVARWLEAKGLEFVLTREPGGTRIGKAIRRLLLDPASIDLDPLAELLLYNADRVQHIRTVIKPHLADGKSVVCDRFFDATLVYQGMARKLGTGLVNKIHQLVCDGFQPDLTLLLDLDPLKGLERTWQQVDSGKRSQAETRFENEKLEFHRRVRAGYLQLAEMYPRRIKVIDASGSLVQVARKLEKILDEFLEGFNKNGHQSS